MAKLRSNFQILLLCGSFFIFTCGLNNFCSIDMYSNVLFIFGDSLFDAGSSVYLPASAKNKALPYGETFFKHSTGRFCDADYAKLPFIPPYQYMSNNIYLPVNGMNFACRGAGALAETHHGETIDLKTQVHHFKAVMKLLRKKVDDEEIKEFLSGAVFLVSIGGNDYRATFASGSNQSFIPQEKEYVKKVIGSITDVIKGIYEEGGRKFGFVSVGAMGCLPSLRAANPRGDCDEKITRVCKLHNQEFSKALKTLQKQLNRFKYANFDFFNTLFERAENPTKFGFKEAGSCCDGEKICDNPNEYLFFDNHPSEKANKQFAELMWHGNSDVISPYNLKNLFKA